MWGTWVVLVALCVAGNVGVSSEDVMGHLHWCNTLCMCHDTTQVEVKCFERNDIYDLLGLTKVMVYKLEQTNWKLEDKVLWCNDTCLCHQNKDAKVFECVPGDSLHQFISSKIGDMYFYKEEEESERIQQEEEDKKIEHRKRSDERKKNRRNRKPKPRKRKNKQAPPAVVTEEPTTPTSFLLEPTMLATSPEPEVVSIMTQDMFSSPTPLPTFEILTSGLPTQMPTTSESNFFATELTPFEPVPEPEGTEMAEEEEGGSHEEGAAELLPKQEAVAASPAVTAMQPPTRRQPFPPTVSSHAATREAETLAPKVSAVLEVPVQRKTVASEVSQDLDELGSAVMQIKSDVVLNQRILLVTVAVAGIAMLGVLMLAVHSCFASKRQAAAEERRQKELTPKDDNHVTKVNLEEAW